MSKLRTETEIREELAAAREAYQAVANSENAVQLTERSTDIKALISELSASLADGAKDCPECQTAPHGMRKTEAYGASHAVYEVGCLSCPLRSRGFSPTVAVLAWNAGEYIV